ncbi:MAG: insulinase family protein [Phycisphaerae bacterium]
MPWVLLALCLPLLAFAPRTAQFGDGIPSWDDRSSEQPSSLPRFENLENGLRFVVVEDHTLPLVSVQLWCRVGSADDPPETPGVTHVIRTILEQRDQANVRLRAAGLEPVSRTLRDACTFETVLPPSHLEFVLSVEAARLRPLSIDAETLRAALRDCRAHADYSSAVEDGTLDALFAGHPYRFQPWFVAAAVEALPRETLEPFARRWFSAGNATLFVIGDATPDEVRRLVRERFADLPASERPRRPDRDLPQRDRIRREAVGQPPGTVFAWLTPPLGAVENAAIDVLLQQLLNPLDGPLRAHWERLGAEFSVTRGEWRECGCVLLFAPPLSAARDAAEYPRRAFEAATAAVQRELENAATFVPSETVHNRNRALARAAAARPNYTFDRRAARLAELEVVGGDILLAEHEPSAHERVSVLDVQNAARSLLERRSAAVHVCRSSGPGPNGRPVAPQPPNASPEASPLPPGERVARPWNFTLPEIVETAGAVPPPGARWQPPRLERVRVGDGPNLAILAVPGLASATVATVTRGRPALSAPQRGAPASVLPGFDETQTAEYLALRGVEVFLADDDDRGGREVIANGPADALDAMLEIHARLIFSTSALDERSPEGLDVLVVSAAETATVARLFKESWRASAFMASPGVAAAAGAGGPGADSARTTTAEAGSAGSASDNPGSAPEGRVAVRWTPSSGGASARLTLGLEVATRREAYAALAMRALAIALGDPRCGTGMLPDGSLFIQFGPSTPEGLPGRIDALRGALLSVRDGALPSAHVEAALRVARTRRFVELNGSTAIADALVRGESNPWDIHDELTPQTWTDWARQALSGATLRLDVVGGGDEGRAASERLRSELNGTSAP